MERGQAYSGGSEENDGRKMDGSCIVVDPSYFFDVVSRQLKKCCVEENDLMGWWQADEYIIPLKIKIVKTNLTNFRTSIWLLFLSQSKGSKQLVICYNASEVKRIRRFKVYSQALRCHFERREASPESSSAKTTVGLYFRSFRRSKSHSCVTLEGIII